MDGWTYGTTLQKTIWRKKGLIRREGEGQQERVWGTLSIQNIFVYN